jgi:uncharacterized protein YbbK (DUF523 family)
VRAASPQSTEHPPDDAPLVGVSACLLGEAVRHDGSDRRAARLIELLGRHVRIVSTCPEVLAGMGVPREPVHLHGDPSTPRVLGVTSRRDWTAALVQAATQRAAELVALGICGHVLKSRSPSCGVRGIPVRSDRDGPAEGALRDGVFVAHLRRALPGLPLAEEIDLDSDEAALEFVARARAYRAARHCV